MSHRKRREPRGRRLLPPLGLLAALVAIWYVLVFTGGISELILPPPDTVAEALLTHAGMLSYHAGVTTLESLGGFVIAMVLAVLAGLAMVAVPVLERAATPWVIAGQAFPKEALAPLLAVWLGYGAEPKIVLAGMICFFPLAIAFSRGLLATDRHVVDMLRMLGATRGQELRYYRLPNSVSGLLTGIRITLPLSLIGAVVGEFAGSSAGLGHLIRVNKGHLESGLVYSCLVILALLGILYYGLVLLLERPLHRYVENLTALSH